MKNGDDLWIVLGKTSEWDDENMPDSPAPGNNTLVEPFLAIKPIVKSLAREVIYQDYEVLSQYYKFEANIDGVLKYFELVDDVVAYTNVGKYLVLQALYDPIIAEHPSFTSFRVYYVVSGLVPAPGHESANWLIDANIEDYGLVELENAGTKVLGGSQMTLPAVLLYR